MAKRKTAVPPRAPAGAKPDGNTYALGPQNDGAYVIRIPDDFHLMILRKAMDRHEKNVNAAPGTLSPLFDGPDPMLERARNATTTMKNIIVMARSAEDQVSDTPIGKAISHAAAAAVRGEKGEPVDGAEEGTVWAPHAPVPRPRRGQYIRLPGGAAVSVERIEGYDDTAGAFIVEASNGTSNVIAHEAPSGEIEWRIKAQLGEYETPLNVPDVSVAKELADAASGGAAASDDALTQGAPTYTDDDDDDRPRTAVETDTGNGDVVEGTDASGERTVEKRPRTAKKTAAQRDRNAQSAGVKRGNARTPAKPISGGKRGGKR